MKLYKPHTTVLFILMITVMACKKNNVAPMKGASSLTVVNTLLDTAGTFSNLVLNFNYHIPMTYFSNAAQLGYTSFTEYNSYSGVIPLGIYNYPDTTHAVFLPSLNLQPSAIYSLFLAGTINKPDYLLTTDNPPAHKDSTLGVRFINLSQRSNPVSVNIQGQNNGSEVNSLAYKGITPFKNYAATSGISTYIFEFRDSTTGTLLSNYEIDGVNNGTKGDTNQNNVRYKNFTIVLFDYTDSTGSTNQYTIIVNNF